MPSRQVDSLRVATLNVWGRFADWPSRQQVLRDEWRAVDADVLLLQEVCRDEWGDQAAQIADCLDYSVVVATDGHQIPGGSEGLAVLSRLHVDGAVGEELPPSDPPRRALMTTLQWRGARLTLVCGHTVAVPDDIRSRQVDALLSRPEDPLIIGADLNAPPTELDGALARNRLADALGTETTPTWPVCDVTFGDAWTSQFGRAPHFSLTPRRLDYLLTRGLDIIGSGVHVLGSRDRGFASDHAVVWADITLQRP